MNHPATSDDINVLAPPSSLQMRKCRNSPPIAHRNQIRQHRPRLTSHRAIMRLHGLHSMDLGCKEQEVRKHDQTSQNSATTSLADNSTLFDETACTLLFTPPGGSSYLPGSTPQSIGLDIDTITSDASSSSPRQVASTPPRLHRRQTTPVSAKRGNVSHLCIEHIFEEQPSATSTSPNTRPFRLQMKRSSPLAK